MTTSRKVSSQEKKVRQRSRKGQQDQSDGSSGAFVVVSFFTDYHLWMKKRSRVLDKEAKLY
jgi:hypothetical protein